MAENGMKEQAAEVADEAMAKYDEALSNLDALSEKVQELYDAAVSAADSEDETDEDEESDEDEDGDSEGDDEVTEEADEVLDGF
jgi:hypothetical protein